MKATGIIRKFDENGRIVLPMELRKMLGLNNPDEALEIFMDGDAIVLKKYESTCVFCHSSDNLVVFKDKKICPKCAEKISVLFSE